MATRPRLNRGALALCFTAWVFVVTWAVVGRTVEDRSPAAALATACVVFAAVYMYIAVVVALACVAPPTGTAAGPPGPRAAAPPRARPPEPAAAAATLGKGPGHARGGDADVLGNEGGPRRSLCPWAWLRVRAA